jgi:hypothetical protein
MFLLRGLGLLGFLRLLQSCLLLARGRSLLRLRARLGDGRRA